MSHLAEQTKARPSPAWRSSGRQQDAAQSPAYARMVSFALFMQSKAASAWRYLAQQQGSPLLGRRQRRLRISESVSLGEKRSVAILEVDGQAFLVGSSGTSISLLATFEPQPTSFHQVLTASFSRGEGQQ